MSYMFELFDLVQGTRGRKNTEDQSNLNASADKNNNNNNNNNSVDAGESQGGRKDESDSEVGNESDHHHRKVPALSLSGLSGRSNSVTGPLSNRSPRGQSSNSLNSSTPRSPRSPRSPRDQTQLTESTTPFVPITESTGGVTIVVSESNDQETNGADDYSQDGANETPAGDTDDKPKEFDEESDEEKFKKFTSWSNVLKLKYLKTALKYHADLFLLAMMVTLLSCAYISFYITLGNRFTFQDKDTWPTWGVAFDIICGCVNEQFLVSIGYMILRSQFGHKQTKVAIPYALFFSCASVALTATGRYYDIEGTANYVPKYFLAMGNIVVISMVVGVKTFKRKMFAFWFSLPFAALLVVLMFYDYLLLKWYIQSNSEISKSVIRIVVHPFVTAVCLLISRVAANQLAVHKPRSILSFVLLPLTFNTFYGRLFGNTMNSLVSVSISSMVIGLVDMFWKCSLRARDSIIVKYICKCSRDASFYMKHNLPLYAEYQSFELIYEVSANFVATFLIITYFFVYGSTSHIPFQFKIMAIQLSFTLVTEFVVSYVSISYLKLPIVIPWSKRPDGFLFILNFCWLVGIAYTSIRIINILNGNWIL